MSKAKKTSKNLKNSRAGAFNTNLLIFIALFAVVAGLLIWRAFAVTSGTLDTTSFVPSSSAGAQSYSKCDPPADKCKKDTNFVQLAQGAGNKAVFTSTSTNLDQGLYTVCINSARIPNSGTSATGNIVAAGYYNGVKGNEFTTDTFGNPNSPYSLSYSDKYGAATNCLNNLFIDNNASGITLYITNIGTGPINIASISITQSPGPPPYSSIPGGTNSIILDSGSCGRNLQIGGIDPTLTNVSTPTFFLKGDGGGSQYQVSLDGQSIGSAFRSDVEGKVCINLTTPVSDGSHTLNAIELKPKLYTLSTYTFKVDTTPYPAPSKPVLDSSADSAPIGDNVTTFKNLRLKGTGTPGAPVQVKEGVKGVGGGTVDASGNWMITTLAQTAGVHNYYATVTDPAGNISAPSPTLTVTIQ